MTASPIPPTGTAPLVAVGTAKAAGTSAASAFAGILAKVVDPQAGPPLTAANAPKQGRKTGAGAAAEEQADGATDEAAGESATTPSQTTLDISALAQAAVLAASAAPAIQVSAVPVLVASRSGTDDTVDAAPSVAVPTARAVSGPATPTRKAGTGTTMSATSAAPAAAISGDGSTMLAGSSAATSAPAASTPVLPAPPAAANGEATGAVSSAAVPASTSGPQSPVAAQAPADASMSPAAGAAARITAQPSTEPTATTGRQSVRDTAAAGKPAEAAGADARGTKHGPSTSGGAVVDNGRRGTAADHADRQDRDGSEDGDAASIAVGASESVPGLSAGASAAASIDPVNELLQALGTPAQQVSEAIGTLAAETRVSQPASAGPDATSLTAASTATAVKTLTVQLNPDHLGPVSITLRLQADTMDIRIAVATPQALHQLEQDKHVLSAAVVALGGTHASLHLGGASDGAVQPTSTQTSSTFDRPSGGASSDTASNGRQAQNQNRPDGPSQRSDADDITAQASRIADGSLYL